MAKLCERVGSLAFLGALVLAAGLGDAAAQPQPDVFRGPFLTLAPIVGGFNEPTLVASVPGDPQDLVVLERRGVVRMARDGTLQHTALLDLSSVVGVFSEEQGLLGLAFDPQFATNRRLYMDYTATDWSIHVVRYLLTRDDPPAVQEDSAHDVLVVPKHSKYHNGGTLAFGPDGYLYISVGDDEGSDNAQDLSNVYGKLLRIDVSSADPYAIPPDNPFAAVATARQEIWAYGFRNPWRFSFDRATGDLWIGDVGEAAAEEIDYQPAGSGGGNFGWPFLEGERCQDTVHCHDSDLIAPVVTYDHNMNCAVIGGYAYRGGRVPALRGKYLYGDLCTGGVFTLADGAPPARARVELGYQPIKISSFGEDSVGDVYVVDFQGGTIYRMEDGALPTQASGT